MSYYGRLMENDVALSSEEATKYTSLTECLKNTFSISVKARLHVRIFVQFLSHFSVQFLSRSSSR